MHLKSSLAILCKAQCANTELNNSWTVHIIYNFWGTEATFVGRVVIDKDQEIVANELDFIQHISVLNNS